jgi:uncharacterized protein (TIGR01777 family)
VRIVIPGGTGQVGTLLARAFHAAGDDVVVLSRRPDGAGVPWRVAAWDARTVGPWAAALEGADVVINLAGRSVDCRYNAGNRREILASRVDSTRAVGQAVAAAERPPRVWLQAGTATIYAHRYDAPNDEDSGVLGGAEPGLPDTWRFSLDVARAWEAATMEADLPATRRVILRAAMVMSPDRGGVFDVLLRLVRLGLGGQAGDGRQYVSWVHGDDFVRAVHWLIARDDLDGPVNVAAPGPEPNAEFMRALRGAWGAPVGLPATRWMLEVGALALRTETELILKSRRVVPGRLAASGFAFEHPAWGPAARDLVARWRAGAGAPR